MRQVAILRKGAALVALFSALPALAADWPKDFEEKWIVQRSTSKVPFSNPKWFEDLQGPSPVFWPDTGYQHKEVQHIVGKINAPNGGYYCNKTQKNGSVGVGVCFD